MQEIALLEKYERLLTSFNLEPVRHPSEATLTSKESGLAHCLWMVGEIKKFLHEGSEENIKKAHRWIGFIQGTLNAFQVFSVEQLRKDNLLL
jgi:hypothetical protein